MGRIVSVNISKSKGTEKEPVEHVTVRLNHGVDGDAHSGDWHRQISLLARESIDKMVEKGFDLRPGSFAENITTEGLVLEDLPLGTRLVSGSVELEVTQIGKKCHTKCNIFHQVGDCIMPKEGIFTRVIKPGDLHKDAQITVKKN